MLTSRWGGGRQRAAMQAETGRPGQRLILGALCKRSNASRAPQKLERAPRGESDGDQGFSRASTRHRAPWLGVIDRGDRRRSTRSRRCSAHESQEVRPALRRGGSTRGEA